jgi:hypothetical protein
MIALALLLQAAAPAAAPPVTRATAAPPERFSILISDCAAAAAAGDNRDVVVCGADTAAAQRVPLPSDYVPNNGVPSNPYKTGAGALAAEGTPCAALQGGCQVGFGPPLVPMVAAAVRGVKSALQDRREARARAADGDRRQPIDLAGTAPAGHLEP